MSRQDSSTAREPAFAGSRFGPISALVRDYKWIHMGLGLVGNVAFVVGSVMFLSESLKQAGTWLFIIGSAGMLIGSIGDALIEYERR